MPPSVALSSNRGQRAMTDPINPADEMFLPAKQLRERYQVSDMWLHRRLHDESGFPKPLVINKRRFWKLADLRAWEMRQGEKVA